MEVIPFQDSPSFSQRVVLDNTEYTLSFHWNFRGQFWSMSIMTANEEPLLMGTRLVINYPLTSLYKNTFNIPKGDFFVFDSTDTLEHPAHDSFITEQLLLVYIPEEELKQYE